MGAKPNRANPLQVYVGVLCLLFVCVARGQELPDLVIHSVTSASGVFYPLEKIPISCIVSNAGTAGVPYAQDFEVELRLSRDIIWGNGDDIIVGRLRASSYLFAGLDEELTGTFGLPVDLPGGAYYVGALADSSEFVDEASEANNISWTSTASIIVAPELPALLVGPNSYQDVPVTINTHGRPLGALRLAFRLLPDPNVLRFVGAFAPGGEGGGSLQPVAKPASPGEPGEISVVALNSWRAEQPVGEFTALWLRFWVTGKAGDSCQIMFTNTEAILAAGCTDAAGDGYPLRLGVNDPWIRNRVVVITNAVPGAVWLEGFPANAVGGQVYPVKVLANPGDSPLAALQVSLLSAVESFAVKDFRPLCLNLDAVARAGNTETTLIRMAASGNKSALVPKGTSIQIAEIDLEALPHGPLLLTNDVTLSEPILYREYGESLVQTLAAESTWTNCFNPQAPVNIAVGMPTTWAEVPGTYFETPVYLQWQGKRPAYALGQLSFNPAVVRLDRVTFDSAFETRSLLVTDGPPDSKVVPFLLAGFPVEMEPITNTAPVMILRWEVLRQALHAAQIAVSVHSAARGAIDGVRITDEPNSSGLTLEPLTYPPLTGPPVVSNNAFGLSWRSGSYGSGIFRYQWDSLDGPWVETTSTNLAVSSTLPEGEHTFYLQESDGNNQWSSADGIRILVDRTPPVVGAGLDSTQRVAFLLGGQLSDTISGVATSWWEKVSGPGVVHFADPGRAGTRCWMEGDGVYELRLRAWDHAGNTSSDNVLITWDTRPHPVPVVSSIHVVVDGEEIPEGGWIYAGDRRVWLNAQLEGDQDRLAWVELFLGQEWLGAGCEMDFTEMGWLNSTFRGDLAAVVRVWDVEGSYRDYERHFSVVEDTRNVRLWVGTNSAPPGSWVDIPVQVDSRRRPLGGLRFGVAVEPAGVLEFTGAYGVGPEWNGKLQPVAKVVGTNVEVLALQGSRADTEIGEREALRLRFRVAGAAGQSCAVRLTQARAMSTAALIETNGEPVMEIPLVVINGTFEVSSGSGAVAWLEGAPDTFEAGHVYPLRLMVDSKRRDLGAVWCRVGYPENALRVMKVEGMQPGFEVVGGPEGLAGGWIYLAGANGGPMRDGQAGPVTAGTIWVDTYGGAVGGTYGLSVDLAQLYVERGEDLNEAVVTNTWSQSFGVGPVVKVPELALRMGSVYGGQADETVTGIFSGRLGHYGVRYLAGELRYDPQVLDLVSVTVTNGGAVQLGSLDAAKGVQPFVYVYGERPLDGLSDLADWLRVGWRVKQAAVSGTEVGMVVWEYADGIESHINGARGEIWAVQELGLSGAPVVSGGGVTSNPQPLLSWQSGGGGVGTYRVRVDGGAYTSIGATAWQVSPALTEGWHTVGVQEQLSGGGWSRTGAERVLVDVTPPVVGAGLDSTQRVAFLLGGQLSDTISGVATSWWEKVSGPGVVHFADPGRAGTRCWMEGDGVYELRLRAWDRAGNTSTDNVLITWDGTAPLAPIVSGPTEVSNGLPWWTWNSGGGGGSGVYRYRLQDKDLAIGSIVTRAQSYQVDRELSPGTYTLYVQEQDAAGNWSPAGKHPVKVVKPSAQYLEWWTVLYGTKPVEENEVLFARRATLKMEGLVGGDISKLAWVEVFYNDKLLINGSSAYFQQVKLIDESFRGPVTLTVRIWSTDLESVEYKRHFFFSEDIVPIKVDVKDTLVPRGGYQYIPVEVNTRGYPCGAVSFNVDLDPPTGVLVFNGASAINRDGDGGVDFTVNPATHHNGTNMPVLAVNNRRADKITEEHVSFFLKFLVEGEPGDSCVISLKNVRATSTAAAWSAETGEPVLNLIADDDRGVVMITDQPRGGVEIANLPTQFCPDTTYPLQIVSKSGSLPLQAIHTLFDYTSSALEVVEIQTDSVSLDAAAMTNIPGRLTLTAVNGEMTHAPAQDCQVATVWAKVRRSVESGWADLTLRPVRIMVGAGETSAQLTTVETNASVPIALNTDLRVNFAPPGVFIGAQGESFATPVLLGHSRALPEAVQGRISFNPAVCRFVNLSLTGPYTGGSVFVNTNGAGLGEVRFVATMSSEQTLADITTNSPVLLVQWLMVSQLQSAMELGVDVLEYGAFWTDSPFASELSVGDRLLLDPAGGPKVSCFAITNNPYPYWWWTRTGQGVETYRCQVDTVNGSWSTPLSASYTSSVPLADGFHTLYVQEQLPGGAWSPAGGARVLIDTLPPSVEAGPNGLTNGKYQLSGTAQDTGSGLSQVQWSLAAGPAGVVFGDASKLNTTLSMLADGDYQLRLRAVDRAGNVAEDMMQVTLDTVAPLPPSVTVTVDSKGMPTWQWFPGGGGIGTFRFKLDDPDLDYASVITSGRSYAPPYELLPGIHTLYVQERDLAGNWSASGSRSLPIRNQPMLVARWYYPASIVPGSTVQLRLEISNQGNRDARNAELGMDSFPASSMRVDSVMPPALDGQGVWRWGRIAPSSTTDVQWTIAIDSTATGSVVIPGSIKHTDQQGASYPIIDVALTVNFEAGGLVPPVISVMSVRKTAPGDDFNVHMEWQGRQGVRYSVMWRQEMTAGDWLETPYTEVDGTDGSMSCDLVFPNGAEHVFLILKVSQ